MKTVQIYYKFQIVWLCMFVNVDADCVTQQRKLYYLNIITILFFAVFNISSAYYGNVAQENTTFTLITLPNNIIWTFHM